MSFNITRLTKVIGQTVYNTLLPDTCALCEQTLGDHQQDHLCPYCRLALPYNLNPCNACGMPLGQTNTQLCGPCISKPLARHTIVPLLHQKEAAYLLHRFKFQESSREGQVLTQAMLRMISATYTNNQPFPQCLIPTPTSWQQRLLRGFDHAQILASMLAKATNTPVKANLLKRKYGQPQRHKTRAQRLKLANSTYTLRRPTHQIPYEHIALIDDVLTTGTTARHLVRLLQKAGISRVDLWCATRAT